MRRTLLTCGVAAGLALAPLPKARASSSLGHAVWHVAEAPPRIRVDTTALGSGFEAAEKEINEKAEVIVEQSGVEPGRVEVILEWLDDGAFSYIVDVTVAPTLEGAKPITRRTNCRNCVTDEIVEKTLEHLAEVLDMAQAADAEVQEAVAVAEEEAGPTNDGNIATEPQPAVDNRGKPGTIGPLGWAGVGLLVTGTLTAVTGGVFLGMGERQAANFPTKLRDYGPPGIGLVVTGGVALVTGAVLVGLGVRRAQKTQASLGVGPRSAGLTLSGRF